MIDVPESNGAFSNHSDIVPQGHTEANQVDATLRGRALAEDLIRPVGHNRVVA